MTKTRKKIRQSKSPAQSPFKNYWQKTNYYILFAGIAVVILGFILMSKSPWDNPISLTLSPIVLLVAYLVLFPLSIFYKKKSKSKKENN